MKSMIPCYWWWCLAISFSTTTSTTTALPFTRGRKDSDNDDDNKDNDNKKAATTVVLDVADAVVNQGEIVNVAPSTNSASAAGAAAATPASRRNALVEMYLDGGADDDAADDDDDYFSSGSSRELSEEIRKRAVDMEPFLVSTRRALHRRPELMYREKETSGTVQEILKSWDIEYTTGWGVNTRQDRIPGPGGYGIVADIGTGGQPCVLLRADMDALPIREFTEGIEGFKSENDNKMHACGHDGHTTMLLGAAKLLKDMEHSLNGTVRLMFQPAEEGGAGGKRMREEGVIKQEPEAQAAFGLHVWPTLPSGVIASRAGPIMAAAERFEILIHGVGGHAAMPHLTVDPIVAASAMVMNLQTIVSRSISPLESGVVSITKIEAGEAFNIIPAGATLRGTVRALSTETLLSLRDRVQHIVDSTAAVYGCNVTVTYSPDYYPPTVNDPELYETFSKRVGALVSSGGGSGDNSTSSSFRETEPTMGAEDFSFVAESVPSTFFFLGQGSAESPNPPSNYGLHHPRFALDESVMPLGVELHVNLALRGLRRLLLRSQQQDDNHRQPGSSGGAAGATSS